jgi:hypothetical protein
MPLKKILNIDNKWFFTELPAGFKAFFIFIRGDLIVLLPLLVLILLLAFFSIKFMVLMIGVYIAVRQAGEMIYWFSHQFYERKYRPYDYGFKKLDNHAIYILYQTLAVFWTVFGIGMIFFAVMYLK